MSEATTSPVQAPPTEGQPIEKQEAAPQTEPQQPISSEAQVSPGEPYVLPEKFKGKDAFAIARSAIEAEKLAGQKAEEARRLREENERLQREYEERQTAQAQAPQQPVATNFITAIEDQFRKEFQEDPEQAMINYNRNKMLVDEYSRNFESSVKKMEDLSASYKNRGEDFEPIRARMVNIATQYRPLINPLYENHPAVVDFLYKLATADSAKETISRAKVQGMTEAEKLRQEKLSQVSETPTSTASGGISLKEMNSSEIEKLFGLNYSG